jgi:tetratricopeptide (TPR) repeat protein
MRLAAASPSNAAAANYYLGRIARLEGDLDEAIKCLRLSLSLAPKFSEPHTELARIALLNNDTTESLTQLNVALKLSPDNFQANEQLLVVYKRTNDPRATAQAARLKQLDEARSKRADLMLRTVGFQP